MKKKERLYGRRNKNIWFSFKLQTQAKQYSEKNQQALPLKSIVNTWGDEIYFQIPKINLNIEDNAKDIVNLGEIAFWIEGNSIAIGFGKTPISQLDEIRLAAKVNIWADAENPE